MSTDITNGKVADEILRKNEEIRILKQKLGELQASATTSSTTATLAPPNKSGYLFKWQDRSIGWGGTKWGLRFVRLNHGQLSYYKNHDERSPRYILTLKNCAVRDEGSKINKRHSSGANKKPQNIKSSIISNGGENEYHPTSLSDFEEDDDFFGIDSTEKNRQSGSHFYVFSIYQRSTTEKSKKDDDDSTEEDIIPLLRFSTQSISEKLLWIDLISKSCAYCDSDEFVLAERADSTQPQKDHKKRGTLPALVFETAPPKLRRNPSGYNLKGKDFRSKSAHKDSARSNKISYPPSKPMHRQSSASYLSPEASEGQNYRGLFNLFLIILVVSNFRLLLETVTKHGFILDKLATLKDFKEAPLDDFPFLSGLLIVQAFIVGAYLIEKSLSTGLIGNKIGITLHVVNTNACLGVPMAIVWYLIQQPIVGAILILQATITWLKLISYAHANYDYRGTSLDTQKATLALIADLDSDGLSKSYPDNVTLKDIYYFWLAPTLTYQMSFPRLPFVRWSKVLSLTTHLFISATLILFLAGQVVAPNLDSLVKDLDAQHGEMRLHVIGDYLLKLSITSTYIWLLVFYGFFHCFLNLSAELLRFGDRVFYRDWWNASDVSAYWRLWNMPVHYWLVRHVYFPSVRLGLSKTGATFVVFLISAILHEFLISVPCHMIRIHSFLGMMGQIPLIFLTKMIDRKYPGSSMGNIIFWISFCFVGQPMAILLYTLDYWEVHHGQDVVEPEPKGIKLVAFMVGRFFGVETEPEL